MTWAFRSVGIIGTSFNANMTPGAPAGFQAGDLLVIVAWTVPGSPTIPTISGWTQLSPNSSFTDEAIFGKIAVGGDTMPPFQYGTDFQGCFCAAYSGAPATLTGIASRTGVERGISATSSVSFNGYTAPPDDNVLVLGIAMRGSGSASGVTFGSSGAYNTRATQVTNSRPHAILIDQIQTTAASDSIFTITTSPADSASQTARTQLIFLKAGVAANPSVGFVPEQGSPSLAGPSNFNQFLGVGRISAPAPVISASLSGLAVSMSVVYGPNVPPASSGFIPTPGPGSAGPFNNNQFLSRFGDTSVPSSSTASISAIAVSVSVGYGPAVAAGNLSGLAVSMSVVYGPGTTIISAGPISGLAVSQSVASGFLTASALLAGGISVSVSASYASLVNAPVFVDNATGGQQLTPDPNVFAPAGYGGQKWGANGGGITPVGGGVPGQNGWDNPIAETISTAQRQANYLVNGKPIAARESDTSLPTTTPDDSLPPGGNNAG